MQRWIAMRQLFRDLIRLSSSAVSLCPLRSLDRQGQFVPRTTRVFAIIGPPTCTLEPTPSFDTLILFNWWAKRLFSFSQYCSLLCLSLALEALLIGVHCEKRYINVQIQYNIIYNRNLETPKGSLGDQMHGALRRNDESVSNHRPYRLGVVQEEVQEVIQRKSRGPSIKYVMLEGRGFE